MAFSTPVGLSWDSPPLPQSLYGWAYTDVTTQISWIDRLLLIGYQTCLAMELRWRALPTGSATKALVMFCDPEHRTAMALWKMRVEFVVGSRPCSERFFSGYSGFPVSSKTNTSKFQLDLGARTRSNEIFRAPKCFVGKQIALHYKLQKTNYITFRYQICQC